MVPAIYVYKRSDRSSQCSPEQPRLTGTEYAGDRGVHWASRHTRLHRWRIGDPAGRSDRDRNILGNYWNNDSIWQRQVHRPRSSLEGLRRLTRWFLEGVRHYAPILEHLQSE